MYILIFVLGYAFVGSFVGGIVFRILQDTSDSPENTEVEDTKAAVVFGAAWPLTFLGSVCFGFGACGSKVIKLIDAYRDKRFAKKEKKQLKAEREEYRTEIPPFQDTWT